MDTENLMKLGLSKTESVLYLKLLKFGASDVQTLIKETGFYKANIYDALERLCEKGIISKIIEGKKRIYQIQKPDSLLEFINKKEEEINEQKKIAEKLAKSVEIAKKHVHSPETAMVFRGVAGVKQIYSEIINEKLDYLVLGSPKESEQIAGDYYWQNLHQKQKVHKIKSKMIFSESLRNWKKLIPKEIISLKFFEGKMEPLTETTIYGSKVAFVVWTEKPITTIINNEHVANSYRLIFDNLWKQAKN
jgi:sugar-specific transcriptional regulator TrmB